MIQVRPFLFRLMLLGIAWLVPLLPTVSAVAEGSSDARFLAGLRQRGLYRLAETYCVDRLKRAELSPSQRADLVIEWSRCLAERAAGSPPELRPPLWQRALQVTEDFARQDPQNPRLPLVRLQGALGLLAHGELARQEAEVLADQPDLLEEAKTQLRAAIARLDALADEVDRLLRRRGLPGQRESAGLTADQLASLQKHIQYEFARTLRNQAQCYEADSPDRAGSLTEAVKLLEPLARLDTIDPLAWKSRIDLILSHRLLGDYEICRRQLDALPAMKPPPWVELRARAERIRLALATGRLSDAIAVLSEPRQIEGTASAELDYAWLQAYLAAAGAAREADDNTRAAAWQAKATDLVERIEQQHGPYWTRRSGMLLSRYVRASPETGDLAMVVRTAESSFRSGRFDDALAAYDNARAIAAKQGDRDRAFELGYVAATIEHERGRNDQAMQRYRQIANGDPQHPKAPEAHLLAVYHAAQIAKTGPQASLKDYADLLREHLQAWPQGPAADRVRRRLGRLYEHQGEWSQAIGAYRAIPPQDPEYLQAVEATARCYQAWFDNRRASGEPAQPIAADAADAADWYERLVSGPQGVRPERWGPVEQFAVLAAARLRLNYTTTGYARARSLLSAALQGAADAPAQWKSAAGALLVFSLAGGGRRNEAGEVLEQISTGPPEELFSMIEGLGRVAADAQPEEARRELAELQLRAIELLRPRHAQLSQAQQPRLEKIYAQALDDAGRTDDALAAYRALSTKYPRDAGIQEAYAGLLSTGKDRASMEAALTKWREVEKNSPPGSPRWFGAKYRVASLHHDLGNKQQAVKIIRLLKLLHPDLGGPNMKIKFEELLTRCRQ